MVERKSLRFASGNIVTCDNDGIMLNLVKMKDGWVIDVHNPTGKDAEVWLETAKWLAGIVPTYEGKVEIKAGNRIEIELK
jgi:hypothetical protein